MKNFPLLIIALLLYSCSSSDRDFKMAYNGITGEDLVPYVSALGSDEFMGREPFTEGETITINYLAEQLQRIGFEPAFGDSYFQDVPLVEVVTAIDKPVVIETKSGKFNLITAEDIAVSSPRIEEKLTVSGSEMVFAGFGIVAPEFGWDDYANLDVKGKTVVVLVNDPGLYTGNADLFKGNEMTFYGRWTYKYEEAARQGATGILIIHETVGAGYPWAVPRRSAISPTLFMQNENGNSDKLVFNGWLESEISSEIFNAIGYDIEKLRADACIQGFVGFDLSSTIDIELNNSFNFNSSVNVAGILPGSERPDEVIIYSGHWDHFGIGEAVDGDSIYNGAVDNGTTMAWMYEIGEAFASLKQRPARTVMLFFPTAEEQGLLGSAYYTEHPVYSLENTIACINNDMMLPIGRMKDLMITGFGQSDLDDMAAEAAMAQDRYIFPDPNPHTGMYFRSDHFSFARKGVPSLFARGNCDSREYGVEWAKESEADYINNKYHRPADNYYPEEWDLEGIKEDAQLAFEIGYKLTTTGFRPEWKESSEFKKLRK
jgi:Zn-dependent M28 family amino/carboxypeptidase